nr:immunoglobulin heavy chain junction region [Macaca mulatta]
CSRKYCTGRGCYSLAITPENSLHVW